MSATMTAVFEGVDVEYARLRHDRGLIDLCGAGLFTVAGPEALAFLDHVCTRSPGFLMEGRTLGALLLDEQGGVVAEVLVALDGDCYIVSVWPAQRDAAWRHLQARSHGRNSVELTDQSDDVATFAVEGPSSHVAVQAFLDAPVNELAYKQTTTVQWQGVPLVVTRAGVTAEYGYQLRTHREFAGTLRGRLIELGAQPCGSDALDICRLESRFVSIENESPQPGCTPFELGLQSLVDFNHDFLGRDALLAAWASGRLRRPVCFAATGEIAPADGGAVRVAGATVGRIAHVRWSPGVQASIGVAHLDADVAAVGLEVLADGADGRGVTITTRSAPFVVPSSLGVKMSQ